MDYSELKMKGEPKKAFDAFCKYIELDEPRSLDNYPINGISLKTLENYCRKWNWEERATKISLENRNSSENIEKLKKRCEGNFYYVSLNLINKLSCKLESEYSTAEGASIDDLIKIISSTSKMYSEFQKINFSNNSQIESRSDIINDLIIKDDRAKTLLFELKNLILEQSKID